MRQARPLPLVGIGHAAFLAPVHLHVGGVDVDRHRPFGQLRRALGGQQSRHPGGRRGQPGLGPAPVRGGEPARDPGRGRGGQPRHRRDLLARLVGADPPLSNCQIQFFNKCTMHHADAFYPTCICGNVVVYPSQTNYRNGRPRREEV